MALKERITDEMKAALLGGDRFVGEVLRGLKAAILNEEVAQGKRETGLSDQEVEKIIAKEVKKRNESAKMYNDNGRSDLAEPEKKEAEVLSRYLPEQLTEEQIEQIIDEQLKAMPDVDIKMMGQVIGAVKAKAGNSVDGAILARMVKAKLTK